MNTQALGASRSCGVLNKQQSRAQDLSMATRCGDHRGTVHAQGAASRAPARSTVSGWPGDPGEKGWLCLPQVPTDRMQTLPSKRSGGSKGAIYHTQRKPAWMTTPTHPQAAPFTI